MSQVEIILFEVVPAFIIGGVSVLVFGLLPLYRRMSKLDSKIAHIEAQTSKIGAQIDLLIKQQDLMSTGDRSSRRRR